MDLGMIQRRVKTYYKPKDLHGEVRGTGRARFVKQVRRGHAQWGKHCPTADKSVSKTAFSAS